MRSDLAASELSLDPSTGCRVVTWGVPLGAAPVVVAVHGRNQNARWMIEHLAQCLPDLAVTWVVPEASAGSWWPGSFMQNDAANLAAFDRALAAMGELSDALRRVGVDDARWIGFSQGACLVIEHAVRRPGAVSELIALTGARFGAPDTDLEVGTSLAGTAVLLSAGSRDEWLPIARLHETADVLVRAGASVEVVVHDDTAHMIRRQEIELVRQRLAPGPRPASNP